MKFYIILEAVRVLSGPPPEVRVTDIPLPGYYYSSIGDCSGWGSQLVADLNRETMRYGADQTTFIFKCVPGEDEQSGLRKYQ